MQEVVIGRDESRVGFKVPDHHSSVSRVHAKIVRQAQGNYLLVDLGSTSGTFVRRPHGWEQVQQTYVVPSDQIRLGDFVTTVAALMGRGGGDMTVMGGPNVAMAQPVAMPGYGYAAQPMPVFISPKSKITAGLLALFLGSLGIHKFYLGFTGPAVIMLLMGTVGWLLILPPLVNGIIAFVEAIIYLTADDRVFHQKYVVEKKGWF